MSYTYLQEQGEEFSVECFSDIPQFALSRLNLTVEKSYSNDNETEFCQSFQSGTMCEPSTERLGKDQLTFWREDSHAKTYQHRELITQKKMESMVIAQDFGRNIKELLGRLDLNLFLPKTPQTLELKDLSEFSKILPSWGIMLNGVSLEVAIVLRINKDKEYGYLPTPMATDWKGGTNSIRKDRGNYRLDQWRDYVKVKYGMTYPHPTHSELRMGWPEGWTDLKPLETDKFHKWLHLHGEY